MSSRAPRIPRQQEPPIPGMLYVGRIHRRRRRTNKNQTPDKNQSTCHELPPELITLIFSKLQPIHILQSAQFVCSTWHKASKEPSLYRSLNFKNQSFSINDPTKKREMVYEAIIRGGEEVTELSLGDFADNHLLHFAVFHLQNTLKSLKIMNSDITTRGLVSAVAELPVLEELELDSFWISSTDLLVLGRKCWNLKYFTLEGCCKVPRLLEKTGFRYLDEINEEFAKSVGNEEAFSIVQGMPNLERLTLVRNSINNYGVAVLLDGCEFLEHVCLESCFNIVLDDHGLPTRRSNRIIVSRVHGEGVDFEIEYEQSDTYYPEGCYMYEVNRVAQGMGRIDLRDARRNL